MIHFLRNPYDISSIEKIFDGDFINRCIRESFNHTTQTSIGWTDALIKDSFDESIVYAKERNYKVIKKEVASFLLPDIKEMTNNQNVEESGYFIYLPSGCMGWHTNSDVPCRRLYITYASEHKKSFFRYKDPETNEIITDYDDRGITIREFNVTNKPPYFWHCVGSDCIRISLGYRINPPEKTINITGN